MPHTPGPWKVFENEHDYWGMREVKGPLVKCICSTIATNVSIEQARQMEADISLIAAAPDLLEAAKFALPCFDTNSNDTAITMDYAIEAGIKLKAAIQKAERSETNNPAYGPAR